MSEFKFVHIKTPGWCADSANSIYFKVIWNDENNIGYVGCQNNDWGRGLIGNLCYKTFDDFRGKGLTKKYVKEFINSMDVECIRAKVPKENIASQKILEYAGFEKRGVRRDDETGEPDKYGYTWKKF